MEKFFIIIILFLLSCQQNKVKKFTSHTFKGDTLKTVNYPGNENVLREVYFNDGRIKKYYTNGNLFLVGKLNENGKRIGEFSFYTREGFLSEIREYKLINQKSHLNRNLYFNKESDIWIKEKGEFNSYNQNDFVSDTINISSSYYAEFDLGKDTIYLNEPWRAVAFLYTSIYNKKEESEVIVVLGEFNEDFSNMTEVKKDTSFSLYKDVENQKWFPEDNHSTTVVFGKWFETSGQKIIRGYLSEYYKSNNNEIIEKRIYFDKVLFVKDSI